MVSETSGTIHLLTPVVTAGLQKVAGLEQYKRTAIQVSHSMLQTGPPSLECEVDQALAVPGTIQRAIEAERNGASAIVIDCMGDPGLRPAREAVAIPVLGPAETSMHLAAMLGRRFSVVTVLESVRAMTMNNVRLYGVQERLASIRVVDIPVLEIHQRGDEVQEALAAEALAAVAEDGADVVVLGCTGFLGCADKIRRRLLAAKYDVPVIDPIIATLCVAEALARSGLSHSKKTYPFFREKEFTGYEISRKR